jgi:hypothetical protein
MPFSIEMSPGKDAKGALAHTVTVTIDDHETVLTFFESKEDAEQFAQVERARLMGLMESGKSTASSTSARANRIGSRNPIAAGPVPHPAQVQPRSSALRLLLLHDRER